MSKRAFRLAAISALALCLVVTLGMALALALLALASGGSGTAALAAVTARLGFGAPAMQAATDIQVESEVQTPSDEQAVAAVQPALAALGASPTVLDSDNRAPVTDAGR